MKLKHTYILCAIISPLLVYFVSSIEALGEALRPDPYSMGAVYYLVLLSIVVATNAAIVSLTQFREPFGKKVRACLIGTLISIGSLLAVLILFGIMFALGMSSGHWNFG